MYVPEFGASMSFWDGDGGSPEHACVLGNRAFLHGPFLVFSITNESMNILKQYREPATTMGVIE